MNPAQGIISMAQSKREEIERNFEEFRKELPNLVAVREGQYALIRHGEIKDFFNTALDAQIAGNRQFDDQLFSIQCVKETAEDLGFFSYAIDPRHS
jgi:hypothetical protein